jgi:hypothetical protein
MMMMFSTADRPIREKKKSGSWVRFLRLRLKKNRVPTCVYESAIKIQDDMRDLELLWRRKR